MKNTTRARVLAMLALATLAANMSGCLGWEIRDELRRVNTSLDDIKVQLGTVNDGLLKLERTNTLLSNLDMKLASMETTNASLSSIDAHLASLRRTLNNIDSTIPFLKVSDDDKANPIETAEDKATREAGEQGAQPAGEPSEQPTQEPQPEPTPAEPR